MNRRTLLAAMAGGLATELEKRGRVSPANNITVDG